jgi:hypothetical protein
MDEWRRQLALLDRAGPDRETIRARVQDGPRFPEPTERGREPRIAVIAFAAVIAIAGVVVLFSAFRSGPTIPAPASASSSPSAPPKSPVTSTCPVSDNPVLGEDAFRFDTDCLTIPAHQPTTITGKFGGGDGIQHAILVCSAKSCTKESQMAETDLADAPASFSLRLPGLDPGTYFFEDPVHPATANGTLYVVDGT